MKNIYNQYCTVFLSILLGTSTVNSQTVDLSNAIGTGSDVSGIGQTPMAIDRPVTPHITGTQSTFSDYYERSDTFMLPKYVLGSPLYLTGTAGMVGKIGVDYDNSATVLIDELLVLFGAKQAWTGTKNYSAYIYNRGTALPTGAPIDTTTFSFASIQAPPLTVLNSGFNFTSIPFSPAVSVAGNFVVAISIDDTVAGNRDRVYVYTNDCLGDGNAEDRICMFPVPACPKISGGTMTMQWYSANLFFSTLGLSYVFDCDAIIIPIVQGETHTLGTDEIKGKANDLTFLGHYPSPATESIKINYQLDKGNKIVNLRVFDVTGRTVYETNEIDVPAGKHSFDINIETFAAGNLYYTLKTDDGKISSKFVVIK